MRWIQYGAHGWARVNGLDDTPGSPVVYVHTTEREGRRVIGRVPISTDPWVPITSATLKALPIGWIESMVNTPEALKALAAQDDKDPQRDPAGMALHELDKGFLLDDPPYAIEETPKLTRPDGTDPDGFYRQSPTRMWSRCGDRTSRPPSWRSRPRCRWRPFTGGWPKLVAAATSRWPARGRAG
ncbi:hypothetical protein EV384_2415 [Micromonospora kangleipakensis]|uniref:Uncharacterized protein n=1 Tax=Micromonospora kangleipakensis TaxID=1077942 RepID=A0A4Q8BAI1_9ACTN|nr:hypothetical protein [Micromonospora kangleipakensis]RZU73979.1 hypothetical protein EV384_2415 [Micromonospora kangleipakensis]